MCSKCSQNFSLAGQHIENVSSSHGKGKKTKSEFESKVEAAEKGADQKSALNASENLKREVSSTDIIHSAHTQEHNDLCLVISVKVSSSDFHCINSQLLCCEHCLHI